MKKQLLDELIERVFCEGYEYAQKEFARKDYEGLTKRQKEELRKRRRDYATQLNKVRNNFNDIQGDFAWNDSRALNNVKTTSQINGGGIETTVKTETNRAGRNGKAFEDGHRKSHFGELLKQSERAGELMRKNVEKEFKPGIAHKEQKKHDWITNKTENSRGKAEGDFRKILRDAELNAGKQHWNGLDGIDSGLKERVKAYKEQKQKLKDYAGLFDKAEAKERLENIKKIRTNKNLKRAAIIGAGAAAAGAAVYGIKKLNDKRKAAKKAKEEKREED